MRITKTTPIPKHWIRLPKGLQFKVRAKSYWIRHKAQRGAVGTVVACRKRGRGVDVRVRYRDGKTAEGGIDIWTKPRKKTRKRRK